MAEKEHFFPRVIDRTPYRSCWIAALIGIAVFVLGCIGIFSAASWIKNTSLAQSIRNRSTAAKSESQNLIDQASKTAQDAANKAAQDAVQQAKDAAAEQAKQAAQGAVQSLTDQAKQAVQDQLASPSPTR